MDGKLIDVMTGREGNYLLPFLWMHSGNREALPMHVQEVYDSCARAFCVESRPHEGFCADEWWGDMDVVLREAQQRGMQVWILDDKHFPTGYANGLIEQKYPKLKKWQLVESHVDVVGPARGSSILLAPAEEDELIGAFAYKRLGHDEALDDQPIELTDNIRGRYLYWDVPEGVYRIFVLYKSRRGTAQKNYIHMIDPDSVKVLIEAVYEPHYQHYKAYFGNTIAGFFSDEPSFGNQQVGFGGDAHSMYDQRLGQPGLALPWSDEVLVRMNRALNRDARGDLAGLWYARGEGHPEVRIAYMDAVTALWREAFSMQLGEWCRSHNVMYIGHIIEDMNAHARLGCSGGHYFRSLDGQDMAGIDIVLHQILPGLSQHVHAASCAGGMVDPEFFDYVLAKLASSHAHIQPRMKGRAMCEVFGAYGWAEGTPMMKALMDHLLVRGVNHFVPHAFSPKYPDPDCPPHFSAGGHNPQFSAFSKLMKYTNQMSHLLLGATPVVSAAILYHAEAEWSGKGYMLTQKPAKALYDEQLNYAIVPIDAIMEQAEVVDGQMRICDMRYPCLIVPRAQWLPGSFLCRLSSLEAQGLKLLFVDGRPQGCAVGLVVKLEDLAWRLRDMGLGDILPDERFPMLRVYHGKREDAQIFMLVNESVTEPFDGAIQLPVSGEGLCMDLMLNRTHRISRCDGKYPLQLAPGQSQVLVFAAELPESPEAPKSTCRQEIRCKWRLSLSHSERLGEYSEVRPIEKLYDVTGMNGEPEFSGWMRYEAEFDAEDAAAVLAIDLGLVGESATLELNGMNLGERICKPYVYDVKGAMKSRKNRLVVTVANTLVHAQPDYFSRFIQISPSGLLGPVELIIGA